MRGYILATALTILAIVIFITMLIAVLVISAFTSTSQATRIGTIMTATEQPLAVTNGLVKTRLIDGRTTMDNALHALGRAQFVVSPMTVRAMQEWGIANWQISVSGNNYAQVGSVSFDICGTDARCSSTSVCPPGSYPLFGSNEAICGDKACCVEAYDATMHAYQQYLQGMPTCASDIIYHGICEPGGCSLGRKNIGQADCPTLPIGNYCCRPYTDEEFASVVSAYTNVLNIPLLYPGINGTMTMRMSAPTNIVNTLR